jgi:N-acetylornithine carbamoyltransferase
MAMMRHFLSPLDVTPDERNWILRRALELKAGARPPQPLAARVGSLFFNPSLRTRVSWEQAAGVLGCSCQTLNAGADMWTMEMDPHAVMDGATVECISDAAGVLGRYFGLLGVRAFPQGKPWEEEKTEPILNAFAERSGTSIVSLEGAMHHPCQSLADHLTLKESFGDNLKGSKVALMWAWHPKSLPLAVPHSFALQAALAGCDLTIVHPEGWDLDAEVLAQTREAAQESGGEVRVCHEVEDGLKGAKAVYVKSWGRPQLPGEPAPPELRSWTFGEDQWAQTDEARVMHCLPVRRNVEIASSLLDSDRSLTLDEAENRLWAQAGLMEFLLTQGRGVK